MKLRLLLVLFGCVMPVVAFAQGGRDCSECISLAECEPAAEACIAECRGRFFSIDPKRAACLTTCERTRTRCVQVTESVCRARNMCR